MSRLSRLPSLPPPTVPYPHPAKSNGISITMPFWDERVKEMSAKYPAVAVGELVRQGMHGMH